MTNAKTIKTEPTDDELRTTDWDLVVIGRGFSAIVNCLTRNNADTIPERTLAIGLPDPWRSYVDHKMGQYPALLALPGYKTDAQPIKERRDDFLSSRKFAAYNRLQTVRLRRQGLREATGIVDSPLEFVQGKWLIPMARQGRAVTIAARKVDVCSGPGPGRVFQPGGGRVFGPWCDGIRDCFETELLQQLRDNTGDRAFIGERFMRLRNTHGRILAIGEGPLAASVVEHAIRSGASSVVWVGRPIEMAQNSFPISERYDGLLSNAPKVRAIYRSFEADIATGTRPDVFKLIDPMTPSSGKLTIVLGSISGVQSSSATVVAAPQFELMGLRSNGQERYSRGTPVSTTFDILVVSASSESSETERRSAAHLLLSIPKQLSPDSALNPIARFGLIAGLEVPDGSLRVLGAASRNPFLTSELAPSKFPEEKTYQAWFDSLSPQSRLPNYAMGITVGAATIAMANDYYSPENPDRCIQTAILPECSLSEKRRSKTTPISEDDPDIAGFSEFPRPA